MIASPLKGIFQHNLRQSDAANCWEAIVLIPANLKASRSFCTWAKHLEMSQTQRVQDDSFRRLLELCD